MKKLKGSTARGKQIIEMGNRCCWQSLSNLYDNWSDAKQRAYEWCWEQYSSDDNASAFGVGNANSFSFTASWLTIIDGEEVLRVETKDNSYLVWLDR